MELNEVEVDPVDPVVRLPELIDKGSGADVQVFLSSLPLGETVRAFSRLDPDHQTRLLTLLSPEHAADLVECLPDVQVRDVVERMDPEEVARIVKELPSCEQADLLGDLADPDAEAILSKLDPKEADELRLLWEYADDVAGGLMVTEYLAYPADTTVQEVIADLRRHADEYSEYIVQYIYVTTRKSGKLLGVLRMRDLLLAAGDKPIETLMLKDPLSIRDDADLSQIRAFFETHAYYGVPVVDPKTGRLVGVLRRSAVNEALAEQSEDVYLKSQGIVSGEELRSMPLLLRSRRRLAWLSLNIVLNIIAASVIAYYQDILVAVVTLAIFLPMISDMSGCSGNQAVAVSMRELTLGLIRPGDMMRVWLKELVVGGVNGLILGVLIGAVVWVWVGNPWLGLVLGAALCVNTLVAVSVGGLVPLLLRRFGLDPALASGPILTTCTDMCGFFLALMFTSLMLSKVVAAS